MPISDMPVLSMLRTRMHWHQERQRVLAENVANADTPKFRPRDLAAPKFEASTSAAPAGAITLARTAPGHVGGFGSAAGAQFRSESQPAYETRPAGNAVSLEDQMIKVAANQMDYQAAASLYSRSLALMKIALGKK